MAEEIRTLSHAADWRDHSRQVRTHFDAPVVLCSVEAAAEVVNVRRITVQATDRIKKPWARRMLVEIYLATALDGAPSAAGNAVAFVSGDVVQEHLANGAWLVLLDATGKAVFDLTIVGAATRYVYTATGPLVRPSAAITWT